MRRNKKGPTHLKSPLKALGTLLGSLPQGEWERTYLTSGGADVTCHCPPQGHITGPALNDVGAVQISGQHELK